MPSTFMGIEIGKRSLIGHTLGLNTIGHNLSNASVEGYSRQRVEMKATDPIYMPGLNRELYPGQLGQGMEVHRIERVRDMLLEGRIINLPFELDGRLFIFRNSLPQLPIPCVVEQTLVKCVYGLFRRCVYFFYGFSVSFLFSSIELEVYNN